MSTHRASYRKTVAAALVGSILALGGAAFVPWWPARIVAAGGTAVLAMVAWGGIMCLRRDSGAVDEVRAAAGRSAVRRSRLSPFGLRVGHEVQVRPPAEILATLDETGSLDGLPFMPEMLRFCGRRFRVFRRVDKIWDRQGKTGLRRMRDVVLLDDVRCDGSGHAGCQAGCPTLWKEAWLAPLASAGRGPEAAAEVLAARAAAGAVRDEDRFRCQLTELPAATTPLAGWDLRQDLRPLVAGNVGLARWLRGIAIQLFNAVQRIRGGARYPMFTGGSLRRTPHLESNLQPGELVEVRSRREIEETLDTSWKNRGMYFDMDMLRYCGKRYRVLARVDRLVDEFTYRMVHVRNPCIVLEGVTATGEWHRFRAQHEHIFWREIWLRRVADADLPEPTAP